MSYTTEKGITIKIYSNLCSFFSYKEVRDVIFGNRVGNLFDILKDFLNEVKDNNGAGVFQIEQEGVTILYDLFGTPAEGATILSDHFSPSAPGKDQSETLKTQNETYDNPPKTPEELFAGAEYQSIFPLLKKKNTNRTSSSLDLEKLDGFLSKIWKESERIQLILSEVSAITSKGTINLSLEQAYEIILFCALFAWIRRIPATSDVTQLKEYLNLNSLEASEQILKKAKELIIQEEIKVLPYFQGQSGKKTINLELAVIYNKLDVPALIQLDNCPLQRHLGAKEKMLALTVDGKVVTFLPRFCAAQNQLLLQQGSQLQPNDDTEDFVPLDEDDTVFFGESQEYGLLIANQEGKFISSKERFKGEPPKQKIVWLQGDLRDYAFLDNNGRFIGRTQRTNWKNLLFFDISVGNGIAVTTDRRAIDANGNTLSHQAASVSCCGKHYIILRTDGTVLTDKGEVSRPDFPARAVCADAYGYWISTDNKLYWLGIGDSCCDQPLEEILRSNDGMTVFGIEASEDFLQLR